MSNIETTELKLRTTPTGGLSGEHSPYYRRLLSAGYKGFMQGTIGGAGLYGLFGLVIGVAVALPAAAFLGTGALLLIPAAASVGVAKGATTFGNIGSMAAINAESADLAEQRRYLLDRYYELPDGPEGDKQANFIKEQLVKLNHSEEPKSFFHWKTVAICAGIGALLGVALFATGGAAFLAETPILHVLHLAGIEGALTLGSLGTALGALMGSVVGIDRSYVRKWFDGSERLLHDDHNQHHGLDTRVQQVEQLKEAARADEETRKILERRGNLRMPDMATSADAFDAAPSNPAADNIPATALHEAPNNKVSSATLQRRMVELQDALAQA